MQQQNSTPKWFYNFNHWLMIISIALFALMAIFTFCIYLPFWKHFSDYFIREFLPTFAGWFIPIDLALFVVSSKVFVDGFVEYKCVIKKDEETK